jgi:hypothetical protein
MINNTEFLERDSPDVQQEKGSACGPCLGRYEPNDPIVLVGSGPVSGLEWVCHSGQRCESQGHVVQGRRAGPLCKVLCVRDAGPRGAGPQCRAAVQGRCAGERCRAALLGRVVRPLCRSVMERRGAG